jgi:hypothetical protein
MQMIFGSSSSLLFTFPVTATRVPFFHKDRIPVVNLGKTRTSSDPSVLQP